MIILFMTWSGCQENPYTQGKQIYELMCSNCHISDGTGLGKLYPQITNSDYLTNRVNDLPCLIRDGIKSQRLETIEMPAHDQLTAASITNLVNYMSYQWGDKRIISLDDVNIALEKCE